MKAEQLLEIVKQGDSLNSEQINQLLKLRESFPYFQIPNVLIAKFEIQNNKGKSTASLASAALNSPDRSWLKKLIFDKDIIAEIVKSSKLSAITKSSSSPATVETTKLMQEVISKPLTDQEKTQRAELQKKMSEILNGDQIINEEQVEEPQKTVKKPRAKRTGSEDLIETIRKKEKKEIAAGKKTDQIDIIKSFSKKEIKLATIKEIEEFQKQSDLSEKSTQFNQNLLSESYAKLLAQQGKNKKAKEIYQKLMVKFPNKSTYFAKLIKEIDEKN